MGERPERSGRQRHHEPVRAGAAAVLVEVPDQGQRPGPDSERGEDDGAAEEPYHWYSRQWRQRDNSFPPRGYVRRRPAAPSSTSPFSRAASTNAYDLTDASFEAAVDAALENGDVEEGAAGLRRT